MVLALRPLATAVSERLGAVSGRNAAPVAERGFADSRPGVPGPDDNAGWPGGLLSVFLGGVWLVFLSDAFTQAWEQRETALADTGLVVLAGFVVLYLVSFTHLRAAVWGRRGPVANRWYATGPGVVGSSMPVARGAAR